MNIYIGKTGSFKLILLDWWVTGRDLLLFGWSDTVTHWQSPAVQADNQHFRYENPWANVPIFKGLAGLKWSLVWQTKSAAGADNLDLSGFSTTAQYWDLLFCTLFGKLLVNWGEFWGEPHEWVEADLIALMWGTQGERQEGKGQLRNGLM